MELLWKSVPTNLRSCQKYYKNGNFSDIFWHKAPEKIPVFTQKISYATDVDFIWGVRFQPLTIKILKAYHIFNRDVLYASEGYHQLLLIMSLDHIEK